MNSTAKDVVVLITDQHGNLVGTGFSVYHYHSGTCIVTGAHLLRETGGVGALRIGENPATANTLLVSGEDYGIDLAVVGVAGRLDRSPLELADSATHGRAVTVTGFRRHVAGGTVSRALHASLGQPFASPAAGGLRVDAWELRIADELYLPEGYAGAPVFGQRSNAVIGIAAHQHGRQGLGYMISITALAAIWPEAERLITPRSQIPASQADQHPQVAPPAPASGNTISISNSTIRDVIAGNQINILPGSLEQHVGQGSLGQILAGLRQACSILPPSQRDQADTCITNIEAIVHAPQLNLAQLELAIAGLKRANPAATGVIGALLAHPFIAQQIAAAGMSGDFVQQFGS